MWCLKPSANWSWNWMKLMNLRPVTWERIQAVVRDGEDIFLWYDHWHPSEPLLKTFSPRILQLFAIRSIAIAASIYHLWKWRNSSNFRGILLSPDVVVHHIIKDVRANIAGWRGIARSAENRFLVVELELLDSIYLYMFSW
ncbi:hypothetical protein ACH5RR_006949 [Cinchona calisaya]|uniref:Reverse transcriptase zinc-binding domain-containing protein n=1 Tax=Cinchona calisaya TaxID=153742 RepID=A0ABD3AQI4_9GENT